MATDNAKHPPRTTPKVDRTQANRNPLTVKRRSTGSGWLFCQATEGRMVLIAWRVRLDLKFLAKYLSRRHAWRFYTPIAANFDRQRKSQAIFASNWCGHTWRFFFRRSRRCGTSTFFPGFSEGHFEKSWIKSPNLIGWLYWRFAAISVENRGNGHTLRVLTNLIADIWHARYRRFYTLMRRSAKIKIAAPGTPGDFRQVCRRLRRAISQESSF